MLQVHEENRRRAATLLPLTTSCYCPYLFYDAITHHHQLIRQIHGGTNVVGEQRYFVSNLWCKPWCKPYDKVTPVVRLSRTLREGTVIGKEPMDKD
jgi:hypothetical protein